MKHFHEKNNILRMILLCLALGMFFGSSLVSDPGRGVLLARPQSETWGMRTSMPVGREAAAGAFINGRFYVSHGNFRRVDTADNTVYDPATNSWNILSSALVPRAELVGVAVDGRLYAIGGRSTSSVCPNPARVCDVVEIYNPARDTWTMGTPMPTPRAGLGAAVVNGRIYVVGGRTLNEPLNGTPLNVLEIYDPDTNTWAPGPPMPTARMDVYSTVAFDNKVYVIGGYNQDRGGVLNTVEIYDPATRTWSAGPPMPTPRSNALAAVCGGQIYVIGGIVDFINKTTVVERLNPRTGVWTTVSPMPLEAAEMASGDMSGGGFILAAGSGILGESGDQVFALRCGSIISSVEVAPAPQTDRKRSLNDIERRFSPSPYFER